LRGIIRRASDWQQHYVSAYAAMHPWEDFAETWAHYLHIVDTLEMAAEFGLEVHPKRDKEGGLSAHIDFDPYFTQSFDLISIAWLPFAFAMNSVNRAMGTPDLYPFVLSPDVLIKLDFIHRLIQDTVLSIMRTRPPPPPQGRECKVPEWKAAHSDVRNSKPPRVGNDFQATEFRENTPDIVVNFPIID
jgi:hypothetical protein